MFKVSYFMEVLPIIASKVNVTFELTIAATIFALIVGVIVAIIGYYKVPALYQFTRVYVSVMRGTPVVVIFLLLRSSLVQCFCTKHDTVNCGSSSHEPEHGSIYVRKYSWCIAFCR